jgi:hypothetical protein
VSGYITAFAAWSFVPRYFLSVESAAILPQVLADQARRRADNRSVAATIMA